MDEVAFGRYRLIALIGEGGMGNVYRARDTVMGHNVAAKVLPPELAAEPDYEQRSLSLMMPIIDGFDMHTVLQREGPLNPRRVVHVTEQVARALDAAQPQGFAKNLVTSFPRRPPHRACASGPRAAIADR
ncbi:MAG: hypothetical protein ACRDT5_09565 [Mycobacterium sp.]